MSNADLIAWADYGWLLAAALAPYAAIISVALLLLFFISIPIIMAFVEVSSPIIPPPQPRLPPDPK